MMILTRQSLFLLVFLAVFMSILFASLDPSPVQADVGVRPILPGGSSIQPEEQTPIQMAAEVIEMNVRLATEADNALVQLNPETYGLQPVWFPGVAEVEADFTMKNPTNAAISMTAWFPLASALQAAAWDEVSPEEIVPRLVSFQVMVGGKPVESVVSELPNPKGDDYPPLPWASFPVTFPAGEESHIQVNYLLPLSQSLQGSELALYYIFQTGSGWAGPIGRAELILNLPYPATPETLAGIHTSTFKLPYYMSEAPASLPPGGTYMGNQARWTWENLEPSPEDDFAIWLINPGIWQALESARLATAANPEDGQAWLELASIYRSLSTRGYNQPSIFSLSYLPPGVEAYRKAAQLLPEHPAPHTGLALLYMSPYMTERNAPTEVIQTAQEEFELARRLEAENPSLAGEAGISSGMLEDVFNIYFYNDATATAESAYWSTQSTSETAAVPLQTASPTPTLKLAPSFTPSPPTGHLSPPTLTPIPIDTPSSGQNLLITSGALIIGLCIAVYLVWRKRQGR